MDCGINMAENTPESDLGSIECFQNYTAPEVFIQGLAGIVDQQDVEAMIIAQKQIARKVVNTTSHHSGPNLTYLTSLDANDSCNYLECKFGMESNILPHYYCRLQRFEKTNEMLTNCNALSVNRLKSAGTEFKKHTHLLLDMKKDLDNIFKRIRVLKTKLSSQYPDAFTAAEEQKKSAEEAEEEQVQASCQSTASSAACAGASSLAPPDLVTMGLTQDPDLVGSFPDFGEGEDGADGRRRIKRRNSSSTDSPNGNSNNDTSPCTSDTG